MISITASILYLVALASTAVSIVAALRALRIARKVEDQILRCAESPEEIYLARDGVSTAERRLFLE